MKESNTNKYIISVETTYIPDYEMQLPYKYFFTYEITIQNLSDQTGQLVSRYWEIKDGSGTVSYTHLTLPTKRIV